MMVSLRTLTIILVHGVMAPLAAAWIEDGDRVTSDADTYLVVSQGTEGKIVFEFHDAGAMREVSLPRETDSTEAHLLSFGRVREVRYFDERHIWIVARLGRWASGAFLFDTQTLEFVAQVPGVWIEISPDGKHVAYTTPFEISPEVRRVYVDGRQIFPDESLPAESVERLTVSRPRWIDSETVEFSATVRGHSRQPPAEQQGEGSGAQERIVVRARLESPGSQPLLTGGVASAEFLPDRRVDVPVTLQVIARHVTLQTSPEVQARP